MIGGESLAVQRHSILARTEHRLRTPTEKQALYCFTERLALEPKRVVDHANAEVTPQAIDVEFPMGIVNLRYASKWGSQKVAPKLDVRRLGSPRSSECNVAAPALLACSGNSDSQAAKLCEDCRGWMSDRYFSRDGNAPSRLPSGSNEQWTHG